MTNHNTNPEEFSQPATQIIVRAVSMTMLVFLIIGTHQTPLKAQATPQPVAPSATPRFPGIPLSNFPDEQTVYSAQCDFTELSHISDPLVNAVSGSGRNMNDYVWPIIKHHGVIYARVWVLKRPSAIFIKTHRVLIGTQPSSFVTKDRLKQRPVEMTFPINKAHVWRVAPSLTGGQTAFVKGAELDNRAWEKW